MYTRQHTEYTQPGYIRCIGGKHNQLKLASDMNDDLTLGDLADLLGIDIDVIIDVISDADSDSNNNSDDK